MEGGAKLFSSWKLNDEHNLTVLVKGGLNFFKLQEGGASQNISPRRSFRSLFLRFQLKSLDLIFVFLFPIYLVNLVQNFDFPYFQRVLCYLLTFRL